MIFLNFNFSELLGIFMVFVCLVYVIIAVFGGIMRLFDSFIYENFWWFGYKNKRKNRKK